MDTVETTQEHALQNRVASSSSGFPLQQNNTGCSLSFENLEFRVKKKNATLLRECSGSVDAKELMAIMGPSGSGKSTLCDVLANRISKRAGGGGTLTGGLIKFNGTVKSHEERKRLVCYVQQDDLLVPNLTVMETMEFAVCFKFGYFVDPKQAMERIAKILDSVGLTEFHSVKVGNGSHSKSGGLSGGQRRRLSIAIELVASAPIIILDEPLSGLDSSAGVGVMQELKSLASRGHTVVVVVHQPSSHVWKLFDKVLVLCHGQTVYFGTCSSLPLFLENLGFNCPHFFNPSEFLIDLISNDFVKNDDVTGVENVVVVDDDEIAKNIEALVLATKAKLGNGGSNLGLIGTIERASVKRSSSAANEFEMVSSKSAYRPIFLDGLMTILMRTIKDFIRDPSVFLTRVIFIALLAVVMGLSFFDMGLIFTDRSIRAVTGILFFAPTFFSLMSLGIMPSYLQERALLNKEIRNGMYSASQYAVAKTLRIVSTTLVLALVGSSIVFIMVKLRHFAGFFMLTWAWFLFVEFLVLTIGALPFVSNYVVGMTLAISALAGGMATQGYFIIFDRINWSIRWIGYIFPQRYGYRGLIRNQFQGQNFSSLEYADGDAYLNAFAMNQEAIRSVWGDFGIFCIFVLGCYAAFWLTVTRLFK